MTPEFTVHTISGIKTRPMIIEAVFFRFTTKSIRASKWWLHSNNLNPNLPPKSLRHNLKNLGWMTFLIKKTIFTTEELNNYWPLPLTSSPLIDRIFSKKLFSLRNVDDLEVTNSIFREESMTIGLNSGLLFFYLLLTSSTLYLRSRSSQK
jgi:hypothetical protein